MDRQYNDQKKHGQTIQRQKETWTDNTTTKGRMDRQYNDQKKHGEAIQRPKETWTGNATTKRNMDVLASFGRCIVCPCFFWSLYFSTMFLLIIVLPVHVSFGLCIADQKKHGQTIQRPTETWTGNTMIKRNIVEKYNDQKKHGQTLQRPKEARTDNTTTKRNMDRQYNEQEKHGQTIQRPKETWTGNTKIKRNMDRQCPCFFW
jgi:hypothetical protein